MSRHTVPARCGRRQPREVESPHRSASPGRYLRERRERLGLELAALHERTRIRHRTLEAIEQERFAALPVEVILREYVRQIAQVLEVSDPDEHARLFVEKARASRFTPVEGAFARAVSRTTRPAPAPRPIPGAADLLAEFDAEPELERFGPLVPVASVAEVEAFLAPSSARARGRARK